MNKNLSGIRFFAAMNSGDGFKSYFNEIFGSLERLYIIKGGPGTGKSRFMGEVATYAEEKGLYVERYLCSSDPSSLDGIIIPALSLGVIDGTAPHSYECQLVGAKDNIIDLGRFWCTKTINKEIALIREISARKSRLYSEIYAYLNAAQDVDKVIKGTVGEFLKKEKMRDVAKKLARTLYVGEKYEKNIKIRSAISDSGIITLNSYARMAKNRYAVSDMYGIGEIFLSELLRETEKMRVRSTVSYSPFSPTLPDAIYYPDSETSFYIGNENDFPEENINVRRFIDVKAIKPYKPKLRANEKIKKGLLSEVLFNFSSVKRLHSELELIYGSAMDFGAKEDFTREFIPSLFDNNA